MSFETGTASDRGDLLVKWFNFLQANGWTADVDFTTSAQSPAYGVISRKIDNASPLGSDPINELNLVCGYGLSSDGEIIWQFPMLDYTSGDPVSGAVRGATSSSATYDGIYSGFIGQVMANFPSTPFDNYWFFESDYYAHGVVEWTTGFYRHWGMGRLVRAGKYEGGEYYFGTYRSQSTNNIDAPSSVNNNDPWDGFNTAANGFMVRAVNLDGSPINAAWSTSPVTMWHGAKSSETTSDSVDGDGITRGALYLDGAHRAQRGAIMEMGYASWSGFRPMWPINVFSQYSGDTPDTWRLLGAAPDVRAISMQGDLNGGDEFTIGADTWIAFPTVRKRNPLVSDDTETSGLFGVAYKKVLT